LRFVQVTGTRNDEAGEIAGTPRANRPAPLRFVPDGGLDGFSETHEPRHPEALGRALDVCGNLRLSRKDAGPAGGLREGVRIESRRHVARAARIRVGAPRTADRIALLEY